MRVTRRQLRRIIREELVREISLPQKPASPIPLENLQYIPSGAGDMAVPGVGASTTVRSPEELEVWKEEFTRKYGPATIRWDPNGWHVENDKYNQAAEADRQMYLGYEKSYQKRHGRRPSLGT